MLASVLLTTLKKIKYFAWEDGPSHIYKNVQIKCNENYIEFFCCDGRSGIWQRIKQDKNVITGECCIDIFHLLKIFDKIDKNTEIDIKITDNLMKIYNKKISLPLSIKPVDQVMIVSRGKDYTDLNSTFLDELKSVLPGSIDKDDNPIIYNGRQLFYANPRALIYTPTNKFSHDLCIEQKFIEKIFLDLFKEINITDGLTYLRNDDCEIFLPTFSGKMLKIDPLVNRVNSDYNISCKVNVKELAEAYNLIHGLSECDTTLDPKMILHLNSDNFELEFYDCKIKIFDYIYNHDNEYNFAIPLNHIRIIIRSSFTKMNEYIYLKFAKNVDFFACANDNLLFVGGLFRI